MVVGLTGAIGAGKSTVAQIFAERGFALVDCDAISHEINDLPEYVAQIETAFGEEYVRDGQADRKALAEKVFSDAAALQTLTRISHAFILRRTGEQLESFAYEGKNVILDAPLLFESGLDKKCDFTVAVVAPEKLRVRRAVLRGGISRENIEARIKSQPDADFYRKRADYTIDNDKCKRELKKKTVATVADILKRSAAK